MANEGTTRRRLLSLCTNAVMGIIGVMVAVPALVYVWSPLRRKHGRAGAEAAFLDTGPLSDLPVGEWRLRPLEMVHEDGWTKTRVRHAVWVRRDREGNQAIRVLSSICPHLGCPVNWHPERREFNCPCHGGIFDATGRHTGGPPPRSMDALEYEVRAGRLWVRWQDFKIGVAEKIPMIT